MAKKKMNEKGLFLVVIGLLVIITFFNKGIYERGDKPMFDGAQDYFEITIVEMAPRAEAEDLYWVDVSILNPLDAGSPNGSMYVQCSILDRAEHDWIQGRESHTKLDGADNCVDDEPFTQTAYVTLDPLEFEELQFNFAVPNITGEDADAVVICEAYEQCWSDGVDTMTSDSIVKEVMVWPKDAIDENNNAYIGDLTQNYCEESADCKLEEQWINLRTCVNGFCTDAIDFKWLDVDLPNLDNDSLGEWFENNSVMAILIACGVVILGLTLIYKEPKPKRF